MTTHSSKPPEELLLHDLLGGLSLPGREPGLSVGIVGRAAHAPQPPAHCLQTCLGDDPGAIEFRGCPFLAAAARNQIDPTCLRDDRCRDNPAAPQRAYTRYHL